MGNILLLTTSSGFEKKAEIEIKSILEDAHINHLFMKGNIIVTTKIPQNEATSRLVETETKYIGQITPIDKRIKISKESKSIEKIKKEEDQLSREFEEINVIKIKRGRYQMGNNNGDDDEKPAHFVNIKAFNISPYEITFDQYDYFENVKAAFPEVEAIHRVSGLRNLEETLEQIRNHKDYMMLVEDDDDGYLSFEGGNLDNGFHTFYIVGRVNINDSANRKLVQAACKKIALKVFKQIIRLCQFK